MYYFKLCCSLADIAIKFIRIIFSWINIYEQET